MGTKREWEPTPYAYLMGAQSDLNTVLRRIPSEGCRPCVQEAAGIIKFMEWMIELVAEKEGVELDEDKTQDIAADRMTRFGL